ncbi:NAD(P)/FAD-dependent oxidoreductase [Kibdelosporangium persicum]|uniref:Pyridine nucleotide-disulfide oxidoreductase domain-containing protein 2 n=1 Tax=Kibdelosporangium persicum TaxID=2698649 RepID=A0ABX2F826_9PSEU|nr:NAD(P)/FAD-dependent oxidoreductase [Kibdelosporangium persicum]NRN67504.1 FAD-dependent oxidoreductase [Kibdelosporangium persicum]
MISFDVVFVGAGHNALVAAAYLAKAGRSVCLLDQSDVPGGFVRSEELTLPGFVHDKFSAVHPVFVGGPVFADLREDLTRHGLRYTQGGVSTGSSLSDGQSAVIETDPAAWQEELDRLGERDAWNGLLTDVSGLIGTLLPLMGMDLTTPEAAQLLAQLHQDTTSALPFSALLAGNGYDLVTDRFRAEELRMVLLPWLLHFSMSPFDAGGALWTAVLAALLPHGNPQPVGGSGKLAEALTALVREHGAEIRTGVDVDAVLTKDGRAVGVRTSDGEVITATTVVASTTPDLLYGRLLRDADGVSESVRQQAKRYRYRRGCFQISLALSARPQFLDSRLDQGGAINLGRSVAHLLGSVHQADTGYLPEHPSISWHEATAVDPGRAPAGKAVVRMQIMEAPLAPIGDAAGQIDANGQWTESVAERYADRIVAEASRHFKGLEELILARHVLTPADLSRLNPNAGPGDHTAGHGALSQAFTHRPIPAHRGGYATAVPGLYLIGAASWPGASVSGSSGRAVAQSLLEHPPLT